MHVARLGWNGHGEKPGTLCPTGDDLWRSYLFPSSSPSLPQAALAAPDPESAAVASSGPAVSPAARACHWCRGEPLPEMSMCADCLPKNAAALKARYRLRRLAGICVDCGKEMALAGHASCQGCLEEGNERRRVAWLGRRAERRAAGMCHVCGIVPVEAEVKRCAGCRGKRMDHYRAAAAEGLCACRKRRPSPGKKSCRQCRRRDADRKRAAYNAAG